MATQPSPAFNPYGQLPPLPSGNGALVPTDANGNPIRGPYSNVYGSPAAAPAFIEDPKSAQDILTANNNQYINEAGQQINQEAQGNLAYEGALQSSYTGAENQALNALAQTPGLTPQEASQINVDYSQFNTPQSQLQAQFLTPDEQAEIAGNPNAPVGVATTGTNAEGAFLNQTQNELGGTLGQYATQLGGATNAFQQGTTGAAAGLESGLGAAQGKFSNLNTAVNNPALAFDPNGTEKQITDAQVQQMATNAGEAVGAQYRTAEDQLQLQAAASGNTSPLAVAAANARLQSQSASGVANAVSNADIAALQAQQQQATSIEQQREGSAFQQTGLQAGAATTEEEQAQNAAALAGTQNIAAQEAAGEAGINAANTTNEVALNAVQYYGNLAQGEASTAEQQNYNAANTAEQEQAARANALAQNRQATQANVNQTQYQQGTGSQQLTSQGAQTEAAARTAGQNTYLNAVSDASKQAQQGGEAAMGSQQNAFQTQTGGIVTGTGNLGQYRASPSTTAAGEVGGILGGIGSLASGGASAYGAYKHSAKGNVFTKPTVTTIGENGPEMVVKLPGGRYKRRAAEAA